MRTVNKCRSMVVPNLRILLLALSMLLASSFTAAASTIVTIPTGTILSGGPVSAQATFSIFDDFIQIVLENLQVNPKDVAQNLSDLAFAFSTGQTSGTLESSSGMERTVNSNKTYTDGPTVDTGWALETFTLADGPGLRLYLLGTSTAPTHTIIGPSDSGGIYSNANGSIKGNRPHNPFLAGPVTFDISVPGLHADAQITAVEFSFGTSEGTNFELIPPPTVPEPSTFLLLGAGLGGLVFIRRRSHMS